MLFMKCAFQDQIEAITTSQGKSAGARHLLRQANAKIYISDLIRALHEMRYHVFADDILGKSLVLSFFMLEVMCSVIIGW